MSLLSALLGRLGRSKAAPPSDPYAVDALAPASKGSSNVGGLPPPNDPKKTPNKQLSIPTVYTTAKPSTTARLIETERQTYNTDLTALRNNVHSTKDAVRQLALVNPEFSAAIDAYLRVGLTNYTLMAYGRDGSVNVPATQLVQAIAAEWDFIGDYSVGMNAVPSIRSVAESLGKELRLFGACCVELVLDKGRTPYKLAPISARDLRVYPNKDATGISITQMVGGVEVSLDVPTVMYLTLDQSLNSPYSESPLEAALQPVLFSLQFLNDVRRVVQSSIHPRVKVSLVAEELMKMIPMEIAGDQDKQRDWMNNIIDDVTSRINGLAPEDALVMLDSMDVEYLSRGRTSLDAEYTMLNELSRSKIAAGSKTLPAVLGQGGNASSASVEAMLFVKAVEGALQKKLNEVFSRIFTLSARLLGQDVYVKFEFDAINLRPEAELEAFKAQKQSRVLEQLSYGFISDEEASMQLTGRLPSGDFTPLSGTGFFDAAPIMTGNPYSGTSQGGDGGGGSLNETLKPKTSPAKRGNPNQQGTKP